MDKRFRGAVVDVFVALALAAVVSSTSIWIVAAVSRVARRGLSAMGWV